MKIYPSRVTEIQWLAGQVAAWIDCPPAAVPAAGQYCMGYDPTNQSAALAEVLFCVETSAQGFLAAPPVPTTWVPGTQIVLRGPLGHGFRLHGQRLALAALGITVARLLPLANEALLNKDAVTLFTDAPLPPLPAAIEIYPSSALPEAFSWADYLALDLPLESLGGLRTRLGMKQGERLPLRAQALVYTQMPCGGLAECGVCAVPACSVPACAVPGRRGYQFACKDGPVFDLDELEW